MHKKLLICGFIIVLIAVGGTSYITVTNKINKENALKIVQLNEQKAYDKKVAGEKRLETEKAIEATKAIEAMKYIEDETVISEERVYIKMHEMINTKIVAKDGLRWGLQEITATGCDELLEIIKENNYTDEDTLLRYLNSWKKKDFLNGVAQHNYIWDKLGRGEGEAIALALNI